MFQAICLCAVVVLLPAVAGAQAPARPTTRRSRGDISTRFSTKAARRPSTAIVAADVVFRNPPAVVKGIADFRKLVAALSRRVSRFALHARRRARRGQQGGDSMGDARHAGRAQDGRQRNGHLPHRKRKNQGDLGEHGLAGASAADGHRSRAMRNRFARSVGFVLWCAVLAAQPQAPAADRALAREILEELIEIPTTQADGTARAAQAITARLVAAGFPKEDVRIISHRRERRKCGCAPAGTESARSRRAADGAHRRRAGAARRLVGRSVDVSRARRLVLRPRRDRQQSRRGDARRQRHHAEARGLAAGPRSDRRADRRRRNGAARHPVARRQASRA